MIELYGVFYKLITTNYYNCLCCQPPPDKSLFMLAEVLNFQCTNSILGVGSLSKNV